jgi:hypothetical protein
MFIRFLLERLYLNMNNGQKSKTKTLVVRPEKKLDEVLSSFYKDVHHDIVINHPLNGDAVLCTEKRLLEAFFNEKKVRCAISDLIR